MAKIPFTLEAWLKDKSQRVETRDGRIVHNIWPVKEPLIFNGKKAEVCALIDGEEDALVFFEGGKYIPVNPESPFDLFLVTPEEELTPFEEKLIQFSDERNSMECDNLPENREGEILADHLHRKAAELLALAKKELLSEKMLIEQTYNPDINKAHEFGRKEGIMLGKAEALKDLPRWRTIEEATTKKTDENDCVTTETMLVKGWINRNDYRIVGPECMVNRKMLCIPVVELSKLPGFREMNNE